MGDSAKASKSRSLKLLTEFMLDVMRATKVVTQEIPPNPHCSFAEICEVETGTPTPNLFRDKPQPNRRDQ